MAVPHTRPVQLTNHATAQRLLVQENVWKGEIRVPASAQSLVELRLGEWGHDAMGFVAHIPHYVAQFDYPQAAAALLDGLEDVTGLQWDLDGAQGGRARPGRSRSPPRSPTPTTCARSSAALEQQYDAYHSRRPTCSPRTSRCPAVRRSGPSSSSSSPGSKTPRASKRPCRPPSRSWSSCSTSRSIEDNLFRGRQPDTLMQRVFGGQVLAQSLVAAVRTVARALRVPLAALLLPATRRHKVPIIYDVETIRDGRSFSPGGWRPVSTAARSST